MGFCVSGGGDRGHHGLLHVRIDLPGSVRIQDILCDRCFGRRVHLSALVVVGPLIIVIVILMKKYHSDRHGVDGDDDDDDAR